MITDTAKFHGAALIYLVDEIPPGITIKRVGSDTSGLYLLNSKIPIYLKYATKRASPWSFTFHSSHLQRYYNLADEYGECLMVLICGFDGSVTIGSTEMKKIIVHTNGSQKRISVTRKLNQMYSVSGSDGIVERRFSKRSLVESVTEMLDIRVAQ